MKKSLLLFGIGLAVLGLLIYRTPKLRRPLTAVPVDLTGYNEFCGALFIMAGLVIAWIAIRGSRRQTSHLICPMCETVYRITETDDSQCTKCKVPLEDLEGFYDRHPELTKSKQILNGKDGL
jgi:hypothetical protein